VVLAVTAQVRAFSYGGGVQSTAALVLAARREIDFRLFVFANVGDDSEHPKTLEYVTEVAGPYAERHGLQLHEVRKTRFKKPETLLGHLERDNRSIGIPARMNDSGAPGRRSCTLDLKVKPIAKWMAGRGATAESPGVIGLGISLDEYERMRSEASERVVRLEYPLIALRLQRSDCVRIIAEAGLSLPVKSSCWFCPYHRLTHWTRMRREEPDLFAKSVALERLLNERRRSLSKDPVWLTTRRRPLDQAIGDQMTLDEAADACESGFCEV
jgi:hypothetical protein